MRSRSVRRKRVRAVGGCTDVGAGRRAQTTGIKLVGLVIVALGSLFFLFIGVGEIAGGDVSGIQHLPPAALFGAFVYLGRRHPYGVGVVLVVVALGFASLYAAAIVGSDESAGMRIAWALQVALPPLVAGALLVGAARRGRAEPDGRAQSARTS